MYLTLSVPLFLLLNLLSNAVSFRSKELLDSDLFVWDFKKTQLENLKEETLILGDSQAMSGILPADLAARGFPSYNLGVPSQQPEGLLRIARQIQSSAKPFKRVIVNVSPFTLFKSEVVKSFTTYYRETYLPEIHDLRPGLVLSGENPGGFAYRALRALPLIRLRETIAPILAEREPLNFARTRVQENERLREVLIEQNGYWVWRAQDSFSCSETIPAPPVAGPLLYQDRPGAIESYREAIQILRANGTHVFLAYVPLSMVWASFTIPQTDERVNASMQSLGGPGVSIIPTPDRSQYSNLFHDWTHLNICGARKYTQYLSNYLF